MDAREFTERVSRTGGRDATTGVIPGRFALSVGMPTLPSPRGWRWTPLAEVAQLESGHTPSRRHPEYWDGGIPWVGIRDAVDNHGRTIHETVQHVAQLGLENSSARLLPAGTVCLSRTASVGYVVVMGRAMATSQDFVNWVCGPGLRPSYLKYVLLAENDSLLRFASGTTHQTIYYPEAKAFHALLPPVAEQDRILGVLGPLDDKIELNRRTNETLEAMARALFKAWFDQVATPRESADGLVRAGVLEIGDGYRAKNAELGPPGLPFIRAGDLNSGFDTIGADVLNEASVPNARTKVSKPGDVAFTSKGTVGRFARVTTHTQRFVYSPQVCFWRSLDPQRLDPTILYCWMQDEDFQRQVTAVAGQTDMAPYVSLRDQRRMTVPVFPESHRVLADRIRPLLDQGASLIEEVRTLSTLRDLLLPKLVSGELHIRAAKRDVEKVA